VFFLPLLQFTCTRKVSCCKSGQSQFATQCWHKLLLLPPKQPAAAAAAAVPVPVSAALLLLTLPMWHNH
jgi:hypothetical protein